ncbi:MAG: phosphotransferase, partial [Pseudomonadota bacterium]
LMDADPKLGEDTERFVKIATALKAEGLSAPEIIATDTAQGFILMEDLGDDLYARVTGQRPEKEAKLYLRAADVLTVLQRMPTPDALPNYRTTEMVRAVRDTLPWLVAAPSQVDEIAQVLGNCLDRLVNTQAVSVLRDYHAENLLWLPDRSSVAAVGLLDFQDAALGSPAYDLASLLKDARRDVSGPTKVAVRDRFVAAAAVDAETFYAEYAAVSAQRNLRIYGLFARLCLRDGKAHYLDMMPRVWTNLRDDLDHPALTPLRETVFAILPPPSADLRAELRSKCASIRQQS